jgi:hypothetical protein
MAGDRHHDSAVCHLATMLITRIATCMRNGTPYQLRDVDGTVITESEGRAIVKERFQLDSRQRDHVRHKLMRTRRKKAGQESQESPSAPTSQPAKHKPTTSPQLA